MTTLKQLLEDMIQRKASDLHITAGVPPEFRIDGAITPSEYEILSPEITAQLAYSVLSDEQRKKFETTRELDFSFGIKGLSRFRANVYLQRGVVSMAIRQIPYEIMAFESQAGVLPLGNPWEPLSGEAAARLASFYPAVTEATSSGATASLPSTDLPITPDTVSTALGKVKAVWPVAGLIR